MKEKIKDISNKVIRFPGILLTSLKGRRWQSIGFIAAFIITFLLIQATLIRSAQIKMIKTQISELQSSLNEMGLDIAYENLHFSHIFTNTLLHADNFKFYNLRGSNLWSLEAPNIKIKPQMFNSRKFNISFDNTQTWKWNEQAYPVTSQKSVIQIEGNSEGKIALLLAQLKEIDIKNFAKIQEFNLAGRRLPINTPISGNAPTFENHIELKDITLNGLLNYPLTSHINRLYLKTNTMGEIPENESLLVGLEEWLHNGGYLNITSLIVNWPPLLLVGRGELNFDEHFSPSLRLETSSKAMLKLLDDLQKNNFLERKGVFVAKILLGNKAFKLDEKDTYLTTVTPIKYRDGKIAVENITVRNFKTPIRQ